METTNTKGVIAAVAEKKAAPATANKPKTPVQILDAMLNNDSIQNELKGTLKEGAASFSTSMLNLVRDDPLLQTCNQKEVLAEGLKAAALRLPIEKNLGFAYIIPYKDHGVPKPQFQIGYKGYIQLALRTGKYRHINAGVVYEGEFLKYDKQKAMLDISGERVSDKILGYFAYIELLGGFSHATFWTEKEVRAHASNSPAYKSGAKVWREHFDAMAKKTVLSNLLKVYGIMSAEMNAAFDIDNGSKAISQKIEREIEAYGEEKSPELDKKSTAAPEQSDPIPAENNQTAEDDYPFSVTDAEAKQ